MPITMPKQSEGTDKYADWEDGVYTITLVAMEEDPGGKFGPQYKLQFRVPDTEDEQGNPHVVTCWVSQKFSLAPGKESHLGKLIVALLGRKPEPTEDINDEHLVGQSCQAMIALAESGYPRIDKDTFAKVRRAKRPPVTVVDDETDVPF